MKAFLNLAKALLFVALLSFLSSCGGSSSSGTNTPVAPPSSNSPPSIQGENSFAVNENQAFEVTLSVSDPDGDAVTLSLAGPDSSKFALASESRLLSLIQPADYEVPSDADANNVFSFTITASDGSLSTSTDFLLSIVNVDPLWNGKSSLQVDENQVAFVPLFELENTIPSEISVMSSKDGPLFSLDSSTGILASSSSFDFETPEDEDQNNIYEIDVSYSDGVEEGVQLLTLSVQNTGTVTSLSILNDGEISLFSDQTTMIQAVATGLDSDDDIIYSISDNPPWVTIDEQGGILVAPKGEAVSSGLYTFQVSAQSLVSGETEALMADVEILEPVLIVEGQLGGSSSRLESAWQDVIIVASEPLSRDYAIRFEGARPRSGDAIFRLTSSPEFIVEDRGHIDVTRDSIESLTHNYLPVSDNSATQNKKSTFANTISRASTFNDTRVVGCDYSQADDNIGYTFSYTWQATRGIYDPGLGSPLSGPARLSKIPRDGSDLRIRCASMLKSQVSRTQAPNAGEPVLFIHGYQPTSSLNTIDYWGTLPGLLNAYANETTGQKYSPYIFQWRTDSSFRIVGDDLVLAIEEISQVTGKKVHIVAHSFGGLLARTILQELNLNPVSMSGKVASLTTIGTPHSGILSSERRITLNGVTSDSVFPKGRDGFASAAIKACLSISCYQAGKGLTGDSRPNADTSGSPGEIVYQLDESFDTYPNVPTLVLIAAASDSFICVGPKSNCTAYSVVDEKGGDRLISLKGQRIRPGLGFGPPIKDGTFEERTLNHFTASDLDFKPSTVTALLSGLQSNGSYRFSGKYDSKGSFPGFHHSFQDVTYRLTDGTFISSVHEVDIEPSTCSPTSYASCRHPTWLNLIDFLNKNPAGTSTSSNFDFASGRIQLVLNGQSFENYALEAVAKSIVSGTETVVRREVFSTSVTDPVLRFRTLGGGFEYFLRLIPEDDTLRALKSRVSLSSDQLLAQEEGYFGSLVILRRNSVGGGGDIPSPEELRQQVNLSVERKDTSQAIEVFSVSFLNNAGEEIEYSVSSGNLTIELAPGNYLFTISSSGYDRVQLECLVEQDRSSDCIAEMVAEADPPFVQKRYQILSLNRNGDPSDGGASDIAISGSRFVAYESEAPNLVNRDENNASDIFILDRQNKSILRASVSDHNGEANGNSDVPKLSEDGDWIAYESTASNLVEGDLNGKQDVFIKYRFANSPIRVSVGQNGEEGSQFSTLEDLSDNGEVIVFTSSSREFNNDNTEGRRYVFAYNRADKVLEPIGYGTAAVLSGNGRFVSFHTTRQLLGADTDNLSDVYVYDRSRNILTLLNIGNIQPNDDVYVQAISRTGLFVVISSKASNLTNISSNGAEQIYRIDRLTGAYTPISMSVFGEIGNGESEQASISADGKRIVFQSEATNLHSNDNDVEHDILLWDETISGLQLVTAGPDGESADGISLRPDISPDGEDIVFTSTATNLTTRKDNGQAQAWLVIFD